MSHYFYLNETTSTNQLLKQWMKEGILHEGTILRTDFQSTGKGQGANLWESERGKNLLFSMVLYPHHIAIEEQFLISQIVALGITDVLNTLLSPECCDVFTVKWPNDIYYEQRKLGGILIENNWQGGAIASSIIGVGININQINFKSHAPNPISLKQITGKRWSLMPLLNSISNQIISVYLNEEAESIRARYMQRLFRNNGLHLFKSDNDYFEASILKIENDGRLILKEKTGTVSGFYFKEVEFVL